MRFESKYYSIIIISIILLLTIWRTRPFSANLEARRGDVDGVTDGWLIPNVYKVGDPVEIIVNKVESDLTQFPYAYYDLPFTCPPTMHKKPLHLSLNEIIRGDRKWQSDYKLQFALDNDCEILCSRKTKADGIKKAQDLVKDGYVVQWLIDDDLPASTTFISTSDNKKYYASGFPLGSIDKETGKVYLNNHVMLVVRFHAIDDDHFTIVGFEIYPKSVSDFHCPGAARDFEQYELVVPEDPEELTFIPFTYSVYWREEFDIEWKDRYNLFLSSGEISNEVSKKFHWISLANSLGVVFLISFVVAVISIKVFNTGKFDDQDIHLKENAHDSVYHVAKKWIYNDKTPRPRILFIFVSMGVQFLFTIVGSLTISCSLNKSHNIRNSVLTIAIVFFILGAYMASYVGTKLLMEHNRLNSKSNSVKMLRFSSLFSISCGSLLPGLFMVIMLVLNSIVWAHDSTNALPFGTIVLFISIYFVICIPLSLLGGAIAMEVNKTSSGNVSPTTSVSNYFEVKQGNGINLFSFDTLTLLSILSCGIIPFLIIYVELQYVYKSVWFEKTTFYYYYGFLLANIVLLTFVICEISIINCYLMMKLSKSDNIRDWRWKCFQISSGCAWYMELYSLYYIFRVLHIRGFSSIFISVCYSALFNVMAGCAMGALGYLTSSVFVKNIAKFRTKD